MPGALKLTSHWLWRDTMTVSSFHIKANASSKSPTKAREKVRRKREDARLFWDS